MLLGTHFAGLMLLAVCLLNFSVTYAAKPPAVSPAKRDADLKNTKSTFSKFALNIEKYKKADSLPVCNGQTSTSSCKIDAGVGPRLRKFQLSIDQGPLSTTGVSDQRDFIRVNGQSPGPVIEVNQYDVIDVTVINRLATETIIHWHGMLQTGTTFSDGAPGLSQCPIPAGDSFSYRFVAEISGTFWYHGHIHDQYTDGLRGMLIIHRPASLDVKPRKIDATFLVAEYVPLFSPTIVVENHCSVVFMNGGAPTFVPLTSTASIPITSPPVAGLTPGAPPVPGLLLTFTNGTSVLLSPGSRNPCGGGGATRTEVNGNVDEMQPILVDLTGSMTDISNVVLPRYSPFYLKTSSTNGRLRFINGAARTPFQVFVHGYDALLTEIDGVLTTAKGFSNIHFHVAQRVVFEFDPARVTNQTILDQGYAVFYILVGDAAAGITTDFFPCNPNPVQGVQGCLPVRTGYIVFNGRGAATVRALIAAGTAALSLSAPDTARMILKPGQVRARRATDITEANNLDTVPVDQLLVITSDQVTHVINLAVNLIGGLFGFNGKLFSQTRQYTNPPYALAGYAENKFGNREKLYAPWGGNNPVVTVPDSNLTFSTPYGAVVEIRITGAIGHPIHLHGHIFNVVAGNNSIAKRDVAVGGITLAGEAPPAGGPFAGPPQTLIFRFRNDNPGAWAIHCHIDWHMDMGLFALVLEASDKLYMSGIRIPNDNFKSCRAYPLCNSTNICPEKDAEFERGRQANLMSMLNPDILDMSG